MVIFSSVTNSREAEIQILLLTLYLCWEHENAKTSNARSRRDTTNRKCDCRKGKFERAVVQRKEGKRKELLCS